MGWQPGEHVVRREVWNGNVWMASDAIVVRDKPEQLVIFTPTGAPMGYPDGDWPTADGRHAWHDKPRWHGHGCLQLIEPNEEYTVWVFWNGPDRTFSCWYVNLQAPFVRTAIGIDTLDHEVDVIMRPSGEVELKDIDSIGDCVRYGRFDQAFADAVIQRGHSLADRLKATGIWWDPSWSSWTPPEEWQALEELPQGWEVLGMRDASAIGNVRS